MAHLGVLCYSGAGHLNPLVALARELASRGHRATFFLPREFESQIRRQGLDFFPIDAPEVEPARRDKGSEPQPKPGWVQDARTKLSRLDKEIGVYMRQYLAAISAAGVDALLMGEITLAGPTVAEILRKPYFVVSTSIPHNFGWDAPPALLPQRTWQEQLQTRIFEVSIFCMRGPVRRILDRYRRQAGLGPVADIGATFPELAHITQWPQCLDIARMEMPDSVLLHGAVCRWRRIGSLVESFPGDQLNGMAVGPRGRQEPTRKWSILKSTLVALPQHVPGSICSFVAHTGRPDAVSVKRCAEFARKPGVVVENALRNLDLSSRADRRHHARGAKYGARNIDAGQADAGTTTRA